jgi:serine/threonine protein kinase
MMISNDYYAALSPQLLRSLSIRSAEPSHSIEQSDMFSLGVTMLCAATNEHFTIFYDFEKFEVKFGVIVAKLNGLIAKGYSKLFVGTLSNLLNKDEDKRPSPEELLNFIRVNSEDRY